MKRDLSNFRTWTRRTPASNMSLHWVTAMLVIAKRPQRTSSAGTRFVVPLIADRYPHTIANAAGVVAATGQLNKFLAVALL